MFFVRLTEIGRIEKFQLEKTKNGESESGSQM
jgi:hypothetical protein